MRFYIVPKAIGARGMFVPKYIAAMGLGYEAMDFGREDTYLVACAPDAAQHTTLAGNIDVIAIPVGLDSTVGLTALSTVQQKLEGLKVPSEWVTQFHTYRDVVRMVGKMFVLRQAFNRFGMLTFAEENITLDMRFNQMTARQRDILTDAAAALGLVTTGITGPTTFRQALRIVAEQIPAFQLRGEVF